MNRFFIVFKRILVGRPVSSHAELHHRLPKRIALAVFSSDALSSSAYATDEILLGLLVAGSAALSLSVPIAAAVAIVLAVVVASYRQTVRAYPKGGGAYRVAHDNLHPIPGLIAGSSLLIDYVLTVSVSVAAGVKAVVAAFPAMEDDKLMAAAAVVAFLMLMNLRGLKESGTLFSVPTYGFLFSMFAMIGIGLFRVATGNFEPLPSPSIEADASLTLFLVLHAFARGSTALTGIEAISDGVPAFRPPESRNAAATLAILGILLTSLFLGITFLGSAYNVDPVLIDEADRSVPSQIASAVFGTGSALFFVIQAFTALILFLAANTAYADFPRLASILARDRYLPRVFQNRGDKLAFSNGIAILSVAAVVVLAIFRADLHAIIPLYVIGVFTSFTLSQSGMIMRWMRRRSPGWRRSAAINTLGAATTFIVLVIQAVTKFAEGAWIVMLMIPSLALLLWGIKVHYTSVAARIVKDMRVPSISSNRIVVLVSEFPGATLKALSFARAFNPDELSVLAFRVAERKLRRIRQRWQSLGVEVPIQATGHRVSDLLDYVRGLEPTLEDPVTLVIPDPQTPNPIAQIIRGRTLLRIKGVFLDEPGVVVASVPFRPEIEPEPERLRAPARISMMVVVSGINLPTLRALEYARALNPAEMKAVTVSLDPDESAALVREWGDVGLDIPLEVVDSPYRSVIQPLLEEVRSLSPNPNDAVGVVIPEYIVDRWWQHLLHGQTPLLIKTALLFEPNVVVIDVTYPIGAKRLETAEV
ncbi:MAG: APC family permease [Actinomycetota bacterium]